MVRLLARRASIRKRHAPPTVDPWPTGGDPSKADASGTIQALVNAAPNGTSGTPTVITIPDGVYRETVTFNGRSNLHLKPQNAGKVEIRGTNKWITGDWTDLSGNGTGPWESTTKTVPALTVEDRWQFQDITPLTPPLGVAANDYQAGDTRINVVSTSELSVGQMVNIGFGSDQVSTDRWDLVMIMAKGTNAGGPYIDISPALSQTHWHDLPLESSEVCYAMASFPEQVYINGPSERAGGNTLRRSTSNAPGAGDFHVHPTTRKVRIGQNPSGKVLEVTVRDNCIAFTGTNTNITIEGISCLYGGNQNISLSSGCTGVTITKCESAYAHTVGLSGNEGINTTMSFNHSHHNGHFGANCNETSFVFAKNEIAYNNVKLFKFQWGAGGVKINTVQQVTTQENHIHHNWGNGLWFDIEPPGSQDISINGDRCHHNAQQGLRIEDTHGVVATGVVCYENGYGNIGVGTPQLAGDHHNISVAGSYDVTLEDCVVAWGSNGGIQLATQDRPDRADMNNVHVNNSVVIQSEAANAAYAIRWGGVGASPSPWLLSQNNNNSNNRYAFTNASGVYVAESPTGNPSSRYRWADVNYHRIADYNATDGESGSTLLTAQQMAAELAAAGVNAVPEQL
jgi:hypothetical protein